MKVTPDIGRSSVSIRMNRSRGTTNTLIVSLVALLLFGAYSFVSEMDHQREVMEQAHYCRMVEAEHWPAYRHNHNRICEETTNEPE